ncbi:MAG TPA: amylo-alpha-1,6-glucosidase [Chryseolinea sp.]|nr:amylo-alpha-1,6-glucosidase [Chryseolinea sp.]
MNFIEVENQHYILATSSLADQRVMVLKQGDTFAIFDYHGDIHQVGAGKQGIYHDGTRHVSIMDLTINGHSPLLLSSSPREDNQMLMVDLTNPDLASDNGDLIPRGTIHILRSRFLWKAAYHEKIQLKNYGLEPVSFNIEIAFDADFSDIFEVRGSVREKRGIRLETVQKKDEIIFSYCGLDDLQRNTIVHYIPEPQSINNTTCLYDIYLLPKQETTLEMEISFSQREEDLILVSFEKSKSGMNSYMERIGRYCADILTSSEQFNAWVTRSKSDLITMTTQTQYGLYPYAGIPWYSTPFGRDGIITAMECLWVEPELAKGVLQYLVHTQAQDFNDFQDAEPGKIFHETRGGEMAALGEIPFKLYYGTIDATPLFISLAGAYLERTNDLATIEKMWPNIEKALHWIDTYGDIDGDGFIEYKTKSSKGLTNQGWKDSVDAVFYEDGRLAEDPIALCEVQGYVYDAKIRAGQIAKELGYHKIASRLESEAYQLKENFNRMFWSESKQTYVIALDGKKNQCNVVSSNAGHCLFSGIATPPRAEIVAKNLLSESMFSGWGIRTISTQEQRYNPMSYHNGSIWPHDNAMIAYGFSRYHLMNEVIQVVTGTFDTTEHLENERLPELFCGFERQKGKSPTSYPVACSPQAWSVGAVFMMIQACLGMKIDAANKTITLCRPSLPSFLKDITVTNLKLNNQLITFQVRRRKEGVDAILLTPNADVTIRVENKAVLEPA